MRLDPPTAMTKRISSVAYAVEEMASDENVARAIDFGSRWWSCSLDASGRPIMTRLSIVNTGVRFLSTQRLRTPRAGAAA